MGIFSSKKIINVSSTLYNMAGDENDRPDYLKGTLFASVMADSPSLGDDIVQSYFEGPGLKQRSFFRYAVRNDLAGIPTVSASNIVPVDTDVISPHLPVPVDAPANAEVAVQNAQIIDGDTEPFFERWILANHPERIIEDWLGDYNPNTGEFTVQFPNGDYFVFTDPQYDVSAKFITARHYFFVDDSEGELVEGTPVSISELPDLTGWTLVSSSTSFQIATLVRTAEVTESYDDGETPDNTYTEDASISVELNRDTYVYERETFDEFIGDEAKGTYEKLTLIGSDYVDDGFSETTVTTEDMGASVTKTTTRVVTGELTVPQWSSKTDTKDIYKFSVVGGDRMFIYTIGSGIQVLDDLAVDLDTQEFQEFYPFLPLRLNNKSLRDQKYMDNGLYEETKSAYRRAMNYKSIDSLLDEVEDNPDIGDIDYAYMIYGVSLNVQEQACRRYMFDFFEEMIQFQNANANTIINFKQSIIDREAAQAELEAWRAENDVSNPLWEAIKKAPVVPSISVPKETTIKLRTDSDKMPTFDVRVKWNSISTEQYTGVYEVEEGEETRDAKKGEVTLKKGETITWQESYGVNNREGTTISYIEKKLESIDIYKQVSDTEYRVLTIYGLIHMNYIYGGKSVQITANDALEDNDESGFIIPLHYPTMRKLGIVDYTQMATANTHILFNCYTVTKQRWYQRGIFKILLIVVLIVVAVVINPGAFAAGSGILGGNLAIGAALGLTGTAAIVAGVVANYLASMIISQLLTTVGSALFGEEWGALFAALAGFSFGVFSGGFSLDAASILQLGGVLANGYAGYVQGEISDMQSDYEREESDYEKQMEYINDLIKGLGGNDLNFNPITLTDTSYGNGSSSGSGGYLPETSDEFIRRTTMTGTDIVDITHSMVYDFVDIQQTLPRN